MLLNPNTINQSVIQRYVEFTYLNCLNELILMSTYNIHFNDKERKFILNILKHFFFLEGSEDFSRDSKISSTWGTFFNQKELIFFLFLHVNICCGNSLETPCRGTTIEYSQMYVDILSYQVLCIFLHKHISWVCIWICDAIANEWPKHMFPQKNKKAIKMFCWHRAR